MKEYLWSDVEKWFADFFCSKTKIKMLSEQKERFRKVLIDKIIRGIKKTEELIEKWR